MPKRGFADFVSDFLRFLGVFYFLIQIGLFVLMFATRGTLDFGGLATAFLFSVMAFGLGILINIGLSIERVLYQLNDDLRRPRQ